jgi:hypothetical protein
MLRLPLMMPTSSLIVARRMLKSIEKSAADCFDTIPAMSDTPAVDAHLARLQVG